jgi:hypothetical protein
MRGRVVIAEKGAAGKPGPMKSWEIAVVLARRIERPTY